MLPILKRVFWTFGAAVFLLIVFLPGYSKLQELKEKNSRLNKRIKNLNIENALLNEELKRISEDPLYQEKIARDKMGIVRKGEIPIKIVPEEEE